MIRFGGTKEKIRIRGGRRMLFPEPETRFRKKYLPVSQSWPSGTREQLSFKTAQY
jgi:hypothetical protein